MAFFCASLRRRSIFGFLCCILFCWGCRRLPAGTAGVTLLYTGGTRSFLEVCGCAPGQLGGVARRATVVADLRQAYPDALLLDAGGLFDGHSDLDRLRCAVHLQAMERMGYDAANLGAGELRFGRAFVAENTSGVRFVSANLQAADGAAAAPNRVRIFDAGGLRVAVTGITEAAGEASSRMGMGHGTVSLDSALAAEGVLVGSPARALLEALPEGADLVVVLSDLAPEANRALARQVPGIDAIVSSRARAPLEEVGETAILGTEPQGTALGRAVFRVAGGRVVDREVARLYLSEEIGEHPEVAGLVAGFYEAVASDPELRATARPRFEGFAQEAAVVKGENAYTGAEACRGCHPVEYADWRSTHHAGAFNRLLQVQKHFQPDCVTCHTTGFGYATGFRVGEREAGLEGVQCETCHGPGGAHVRRPERRNIRGPVQAQVCQNCHNAEQKPDFESRFADMLAEVDHSGSHAHGPADAGALPPKADGGPVRVELFVMAHCPYGMQAEAALAPVVEGFGGRIDFRLHFIAEEAGRSAARAHRRVERSGPACEADEVRGSGRFRSLHGDPEVAEGVRQAVMMSLYPDRYYGYILCRNEDVLSPDWAACAERAGMDADRIRAAAEGPRGEALFAENIRRANLLGINASPTLLVDGREVEDFPDADGLARLICGQDSSLAPCASVPACAEDRDCASPGKVGVCINPGTQDARCRFSDPVPFEMTVLNDADCAVCETGHFIRSTLELFPGAKVRTLEVGSAEGRALAARYGIDRVPAFVMEEAFGRTARFARFERTVVRVADGYLPVPAMVPVAQMLGREEAPGRLDLYVGTDSPFALGLAGHVTAWLGAVDALDRLQVHHLGPGDEEALCVQQHGPERYLDYLKCRVRGALSETGEPSARACLDEAGLDAPAVARCVQARGTRLAAQAREAAGRAGIGGRMNPAAVIDNRVVVTGRMVQGIRDLFYRLHPELLEQDRRSVEGKQR